MKPAISGKIIKPEQCVLAFGIPVSEAGYYYKSRGPFESGFARLKINTPWGKYYQTFVRHVEKVVPALQKLGLCIAPDVTLNAFEALLINKRFDVVILFSHWEHDAVEFHDGLQPVAAVVDRVPTDFPGILDLTVCASNELAAMLRPRLKGLVKSTAARKVTPSLWLYFYLEMCRRLASDELSYVQALEESVKQALNLISGLSGK